MSFWWGAVVDSNGGIWLCKGSEGCISGKRCNLYTDIKHRHNYGTVYKYRSYVLYCHSVQVEKTDAVESTEKYSMVSAASEAIQISGVDVSSDSQDYQGMLTVHLSSYRNTILVIWVVVAH